MAAQQGGHGFFQCILPLRLRRGSCSRDSSPLSRFRMTGGLRRTATQGGPYNITGSLVQDRRGGISARLLHPIYAVILNEGKDPVFCGFSVLFTGFFTAVAVQNDRSTGKGRRGRRPLQSGRKSGGEHVGAGVLDSPCAAAGNLPVILRRIAPENERLSP